MFICAQPKKIVLQQAEEQPRQTDSFRSSIKEFIRIVSQDPNEHHSIVELNASLGLQRRRFYDVLNVFEAIGLCQKFNFTTVTWLGRKNCINKIHEIASLAGVYDKTLSLDKIIPAEANISIIRLTQLFIIFFLALKQQTLDIRRMGAYIARSSKRYKSTLCKLYQIAFILESADIVEKIESPGSVRLCNPYFYSSPDEIIQCVSISLPFSTLNLLNRPIKTEKTHFDIRKLQFKNLRTSIRI